MKRGRLIGSTSGSYSRKTKRGVCKYCGEESILSATNVCSKNTCSALYTNYLSQRRRENGKRT